MDTAVFDSLRISTGCDGRHDRQLARLWRCEVIHNSRCLLDGIGSLSSWNLSLSAGLPQTQARRRHCSQCRSLDRQRVADSPRKSGLAMPSSFSISRTRVRLSPLVCVAKDHRQGYAKCPRRIILEFVLYPQSSNSPLSSIPLIFSGLIMRSTSTYRRLLTQRSHSYPLQRLGLGGFARLSLAKTTN